MTSSKQRSILISGCSEGGAGNALALEFAAQGHRVFATARSLTSVANLSQKGIEILTLDVTDAKSIAALKQEISSRTGGKLDVLFNNAGTMYEAPAVEADSSEVRRMFDANVFGLFEMVAAFTPLLIAAVPSSSQSPTIVNTSSILSQLPFPFSSAYNASKAAVAAYSNTLRLEVAPLGIEVVTLYMGEVATKMMTDQKLVTNSLYSNVLSKIKERGIDHAKSSMSAQDFARQVTQEVLRGGRSTVWKGTNAFVTWLLTACTQPRRLIDITMKRPVGLDDASITEGIYRKGQNSISGAL